jgi:plasmid maintenance system antidote protein VapI
MKSVLDQESPSFEELLARFRDHVNGRIRNGECTERGLARILGISQPQVHNVLKGARKLQPRFADRFLTKFGISILDLLQDSELYAEIERRKGQRGRSLEPNLTSRKPVGRQLFERADLEKLR